MLLWAAEAQEIPPSRSDGLSVTLSDRVNGWMAV